MEVSGSWCGGGWWEKDSTAARAGVGVVSAAVGVGNDSRGGGGSDNGVGSFSRIRALFAGALV
jgi:hypothetical protein